MTHLELSLACTRPPGWPPSECDGAMENGPDRRADQAQEGEGPVDMDVPVLIYQCQKCRETVVVAHGKDGWRLRNQIPAR